MQVHGKSLSPKGWTTIICLYGSIALASTHIMWVRFSTDTASTTCPLNQPKVGRIAGTPFIQRRLSHSASLIFDSFLVDPYTYVRTSIGCMHLSYPNSRSEELFISTDRSQFWQLYYWLRSPMALRTTSIRNGPTMRMRQARVMWLNTPTLTQPMWQTRKRWIWSMRQHRMASNSSWWSQAVRNKDGRL